MIKNPTGDIQKGLEAVRIYLKKQEREQQGCV